MTAVPPRDSGPAADGREMPAGDALDTIIAERLGWTNIELASGGLRGNHPDPIFDMETWLPRWSRSVNDALTLVIPSDEFCLWLGADWCATFDEKCDVQNAPERGLYETADTPALAICRAWLAWHIAALGADEVRDDG